MASSSIRLVGVGFRVSHPIARLSVRLRHDWLRRNHVGGTNRKLEKYPWGRQKGMG